MHDRQTNPDRYGRYRVRDRTNRRSGSWSTRHYNPLTMLLVPNARASDVYGAALPPKPYAAPPQPPTPPAPAEDHETTEGESPNGD